jgi:dihydroxyacetone kinase
MVDAIVPFIDTLTTAHAGGASLLEAWAQATTVADAAAEATALITAKRGRARTHGEHSLGHADPGATSFVLLMAAVTPGPVVPDLTVLSQPTSLTGVPS